MTAEVAGIGETDVVAMPTLLGVSSLAGPPVASPRQRGWMQTKVPRAGPQKGVETPPTPSQQPVLQIETLHMGMNVRFERFPPRQRD